MYVDGDETKTLEKIAPFKFEVRDHANRANLKTSPLGVTVDEQLKWQTHINKICRTVSRNMFLLSKLSQLGSRKSQN